MSTVINVILIVLVFGIIISFHEFGHFLLAKLNGVCVNEFAIGMGPSLFSFTKGETKYSLKLFPIGGYCMMEGEDEEVDSPRSFSNKTVWSRISIVAAGPIFNFILAFFLSWILVGMAGYDPSTVTGLLENSSAVEAGLQEGDIIVKMDGQKVYNYREMLVFMSFYKSGEPIDLVINRDGQKMNVTVTPAYNEQSGTYQLGIYGSYHKADNFVTIVKYSALEVRYWIKTTVISLKELVTGGVGLNSLSGPVGIANMMNDTYEQASESGGAADVFLNFINFCVLLSANLGVMNLLPLPALDGGRLFFMIVEAVCRKKIPAEKEALVHGIGFALLLILMVVVMFNDIKNIFF